MLVTFFPDKSYICSPFCGLIVMLSTPVVGKSSVYGVNTVQRVNRLKIHNHSNKTIDFTFFSKRVCAIVA